MVETKRQEPRLAAAGDEKRFLGDLEKYCRIVTELGGVDVRVVTPQDIVQNIRPRLTCIFGHCPSLGTSYLCPPNWRDTFTSTKVTGRMKKSNIGWI